MDFFAGFFDVKAENKFNNDCSDKNDEGGSGVVGSFRSDDFFDGFN